MEERFIYIILTATQTRFARCIRYFGGLTYNHASVALDSELTKMYSFARPQQYSFFKGKLVRETLDRFTLGNRYKVPSMVFRIPVTEKQFHHIRHIIHKIYEDPEFMYNLLSVLSYPVTKGFSTYKAFSCTEFTGYILKYVGFPLSEKLWQYRPDDFIDILEDYSVFKGNLADYMTVKTKSKHYFMSVSLYLFFSNLKAALRIIGRTTVFR
ncbi:MAG: hypothetical protein LUI05_07985 [Oscillospiraceae bacterium]|nr:hypothetical protein [Oscillospiraceae bacterium]